MSGGGNDRGEYVRGGNAQRGMSYTHYSCCHMRREEQLKAIFGNINSYFIASGDIWYIGKDDQDRA